MVLIKEITNNQLIKIQLFLNKQVYLKFKGQQLN